VAEKDRTAEVGESLARKLHTPNLAPISRFRAVFAFLLGGSLLEFAIPDKQGGTVLTKRGIGKVMTCAAVGMLAPMTALFGAADATAQQKALTAKEVVTAIQQHVGIAWMEKTVDTFKAGDPDTPVTGIATTMMATLDVLQRAAANHQNLIITHEPTFYQHTDDKPEGMAEDDPVWAEKRAYIEKNHLVVWRFHDHWHRMKPDGILAGMVKALGWEKHESADNPYLFVLPETTLEKLAGDVAKKLDTPVMRIVGKRDLKVTKIGLSPGFAGFVRETRALEMDNVEVLLVGETREWETVEYVADAVTEGRKKALIVIGHVPSEQAGMEECERWLKTFIKDVPIEFVPTKQPFWFLGAR
jgi:putative NIF3 family GTP cyclohydrolase 1 type 2